MKVLLLNSPWINNENEYCVKAGTRWAAIRKKDRSMPYFPFPYFLASATAVLKEVGFDAHIKDAVAEETPRQECIKFIETLRPNVLVIEAFTPSIYEDLSFIKEAKQKTGCYTVFCGAHSTALPEEILKNEFMDFVLIGEYDYTLRELVSFLSSSTNDFAKIKGLAYRKGNSIKVNPRREQIQDLDALPFPERDELPMHKYNDPVSKYYPNAKIVTSRGCPYNCIFCIEPIMYKGISTYRKRSVNLVIEEVKIVCGKYKAKEVFFDDAIFTITRATEIANAILERNLKLSWSCWIDWNITFDELKLLKKSGCIGVKFGIESFQPEILKIARKPINLDKIKVLIKNCKKLNLLRHASFMFGLPGETLKSMKDTIDFAFSLDLTSSQLAVATPLPGTPFYKMAEEKGWLTTADWSNYECHYNAVVEYPGCSKENILAAIELSRQKKVKQLLRNPAVAIRYIIKLYQLNGFKGFLREIFKKMVFTLKALFSK